MNIILKNFDTEILYKPTFKDIGNLWLRNFEQMQKRVSDNKEKGMPLGNYTSQFFANIYLNELDYFVKHFLKTKYHIRYVDDLVILHNSK